MYEVLSTILKDRWMGDGKLVLQLLWGCDQQGLPKLTTLSDTVMNNIES